MTTSNQTIETKWDIETIKRLLKTLEQSNEQQAVNLLNVEAIKEKINQIGQIVSTPKKYIITETLPLSDVCWDTETQEEVIGQNEFVKSVATAMTREFCYGVKVGQVFDYLPWVEERFVGDDFPNVLDALIAIPSKTFGEAFFQGENVENLSEVDGDVYSYLESIGANTSTEWDEAHVMNLLNQHIQEKQAPTDLIVFYYEWAKEMHNRYHALKENGATAEEMEQALHDHQHFAHQYFEALFQSFAFDEKIITDDLIYLFNGDGMFDEFFQELSDMENLHLSPNRRIIYKTNEA